MIAATGTIPRPLTLQNPMGTYGTIPAPAGGTSPKMAAPQFISTSTRQPVLRAPAPAPTGSPLPAPGSPATAQTAPPGGYTPPSTRSYTQDPQFMAHQTPPPAGVNPSLAGTSTLMPPPPNVNPIPQGGAQFQPAGTVPAGTTAVSGGEVPYHIGTGPSQGSSDMLSRLATEAGRQLDQPTVYDDPLAAQIKAGQTAGINANYDRAKQGLDASLADRGINYSTIAGGNIMDLETARAGALSEVDTNIARERANTLAAGRSSAFNNARGVYGDQSGADIVQRANQVGERGYTDQLRNKAQSDAVAGDQNFQTLLDRVYGLGNAGQGTAAGIYGGQADQAYGSAATDQAGLSELAQLAAQYFGKAA